MTATAAPATPTAPATATASAAFTDRTEGIDRYVETYFDDGVWYSRRDDSAHPFASGEVLVEQIAVGAEVARWNQVRHIIRHLDGSTEVSQ